MNSVARKGAIAALTAGLLVAVGVIPAMANTTQCNSDKDVCGEIFDASVSNHVASSKAETFTIDQAKKHGIEVIQNYETHHFFGWTTDQSWTAGSSGDFVNLESKTGSFKCGGALYEFYSHHDINGSEFVTLQGNQFSCS